MNLHGGGGDKFAEDIDVKVCPRCDVAKGLDDFGRGQYWCKACHRAYSAAHYEANREKVLERNKAYCEENREKVLERKRAHYGANRHKGKARRARNTGLVFELSEQEFDEIVNGPCSYCGAPSGTHGITQVDRIYVTRGYLRSNVCGACRPCNTERGRIPSDLFQEATDRLRKARGYPDGVSPWHLLSEDERERREANKKQWAKEGKHAKAHVNAARGKKK